MNPSLATVLHDVYAVVDALNECQQAKARAGGCLHLWAAEISPRELGLLTAQMYKALHGSFLDLDKSHVARLLDDVQFLSQEEMRADKIARRVSGRRRQRFARRFKGLRGHQGYAIAMSAAIDKDLEGCSARLMLSALTEVVTILSSHTDTVHQASVRALEQLDNHELRAERDPHWESLEPQEPYSGKRWSS